MRKIPKWVDEAFELFDKYLVYGPKGPRLSEDGHPEVVVAYKKVYEWAWDLDAMQ